MKKFLKLVIYIFIIISNQNNLLAGCKTGPAKNTNEDASCDLKINNADCKKGSSCMYTGKGKQGTSCVTCAGKECDNNDDCKKSGKGTNCYNGICKTFVL